MKKIYLLLSGIIFLASLAVSQQTHFSQFYTTSIYINPALAGIDEESKFTLNYRNQWPQIQNSFITQNATFETNLSKFNNGLGFSAYRDQAGDGLLTTNAYNAAYAHEIKMRKGLYLRLGLKAGFVQKKIAWDKLIFEDMIDPRDGVVYTTKQSFGENVSYADLSSGMLLYTEKYYIGFSANHLNQPRVSLMNWNSGSRLQRNFILHGGAKFELAGNSDYTFSPNVIINKQGTFTKFNIGSYFEAKSLVLGLWYASTESMIFIVGVKGNRFQVGYSYDLSSSKMIGSNIGSHEISYTQTFKKKSNRRKKYRTTSCPTF
ncbi:MAG: type IX secretion system PorP/SprF family membrane protein [Vicingaceae bacterium]|jgi:type IX secretion system PorP/SprF family membrane protein